MGINTDARRGGIAATCLLLLGAGVAVAQPAYDPRGIDPQLTAKVAEAVAQAEAARAAETRAELSALTERVAALESQMADERRRSAAERQRQNAMSAKFDGHVHGFNGGMTAGGFQSIRIDGTWHRLMTAPANSETAKRTGLPYSPK